ncbi:MAG: aminomethyl-transferring glycine dehydrogenase [Bacteroidia bacterium]|nr:aminomethyl-transferring glycine dehydrogenase [Bacteroidia bacterium]
MITNNFVYRHNGPNATEIKAMLEKIGVSSLDQLIAETVPSSIRLSEPMNLPEGLNEYQFLTHLKEVAAKNKLFKSFIGMGYYNTITPGVVLRNILENPGWYTSYTPYQAEISQGRLEALLNFQTMICSLTGLPIANASLLDEGTAAAEAMIMLYNSRSRDAVKRGANKFFVSEDLFPQTIDVIKTRAVPLGIDLIHGNHNEFDFQDAVFGAIVQYPNEKGEVPNYSAFVDKAHQNNSLVAVAADIMSLVMLTPPGEWGADVVFGSTQRFGIPMGYGGPHAAYFTTKEEFKRHMPGRIIGISVDANGDRALRMALQTREQPIKRERATSNICTSQVLLAVMAGMYAVYHGPDGLREIARHINILTGVLAQEIVKYGYKQLNQYFFDTLYIRVPDSIEMEKLRKLALENRVNFRFIDENHIGISLDETTELADVNLIICILAQATGRPCAEFICNPKECDKINTLPESLTRISEILPQQVFSSYHSETEMMRYIKRLEIKDLALNRSMIPLGSCTMKLNAAAELFALSWPEFGNIHPFVPKDQVEGYQFLIRELDRQLCITTGLDAVSFMPNSGASGEYTGLLVIREYHISRGEGHRNVCLIPSSAHGTNPASAAMAGMEIVVIKCDEKGNIDVSDLREKAILHKEKLSSLMVTYPSTHGVFEEEILEICRIIHENGGQVYMDGANMNAQVGLTNPGIIGADVCHLNLHKTFAIPHGGGGPGQGPIAVAKHLTPFLPKHVVVNTGGDQGIHAVASGPYGSSLILTISYAYIKLMGGAGLTEATKIAILNANYLKAALEPHYPILYTGKKGHCAHEMIVDCNGIAKETGISAIDIAKRLMDYGFHAPTVAFPVHGTLMVEPTESEPFFELNRFIDAMVSIKEEINEIKAGTADKDVNVIKKAPHTTLMVSADEWSLPYSRQKAAYPAEGLKEDKYWPTVTRIDDAFGDRNLMCSCED